MPSALIEKRLLQAAIVLACAVPISAGLGGIINGASFLGGEGAALDSHMRYLSGLLLAIGVCFLCIVPNIERQRARMRLLTFIVVIGGIARLLGLLLAGNPGTAMLLALAMELAVTPLLCFWQASLARRLP